MSGAGGHFFSRGDGIRIEYGIGLRRAGSKCADKKGRQAQVKR